MINKIYFIIILIVFSYTLFSQKKDSIEVNKISRTILDNKETSDNKTKAICNLIVLYSKNNSNTINSYIEAMLIKFTNMSSQLFFHEFEVKLPSILKKHGIIGEKQAKIYLIISNKQDIDYKYRELAGNYLQTFKSIPCDSLSFIKPKEMEQLLKDKRTEEFNNYYLNLLSSCPSNKKELDRIKKFYFLIQ